ncbi:MAG: type III pantothenate kinase [Akkermansia sp.]|nr:type III pantothenate kinase [Akkermansia sp.]
MNSVIVDNSNTRTKFALVSGGRIRDVRVLNTADITEERVQSLLEDWHFSRVGICSVVPHAAEHISRACPGAKVEVLTPFVPTQVDFSAYAGVCSLGADRVANVLAAVQGQVFPVVAVDLGTATTFDVVDEQDGKIRFLGGVIAPGMAAFAASLNGRTALLPEMEPADQGPVIGTSTKEAMAAAVRVGYPALVDGILDEIEKELGKVVHVVLTGGDAAMVALRLRHDYRIEPLLTLNGIAQAFGMYT